MEKNKKKIYLTEDEINSIKYEEFDHDNKTVYKFVERVEVGSDLNGGIDAFIIIKNNNEEYFKCDFVISGKDMDEDFFETDPVEFFQVFPKTKMITYYE